MPASNRDKTTAFVEDLTAQGFALFQKGEQVVTKAARAFAEELASRQLPKVPKSSADLKKAVEDGYRLFGQVLDSQRALARQLVDTLGTIAWPDEKAGETGETSTDDPSHGAGTPRPRRPKG